MRIIKSFSIIFFVTFLIGYISVLPTIKRVAPEKSENIHFQSHKNHDFSNVIPKLEIENREIPKPNVEPKFEAEIFNLPDYSEDDEIPKYKMKLMDIIETGNSFVKEEIEDAKSGETWLGLFKEKGRFYLHNTKIKIRPDRRKYSTLDDLTVKLNRKSESVFLLKNAGNLREGEVKTLFRSLTYEEADRLEFERKLMQIGFAQEFRLGERTYTLQVKAGLTKSGEKISVLILRTGNKSQILYFNSYYEKGDGIGSLLWVGDLDRDGKLDLYMDFYGFEKGGFGSGLFLSSEAEKGKLVKQVADFGTFGC